MIKALWIVALLTMPALADDKTDAAAHYKQGKAFADAKQWDQAIAEYEKAYALDHLPAHLYNIGRAYHLKGDLKKAIELYQKFLGAEPNGPRAAETRGFIAAATQQLTEDEAKRRADDEAARKAAEEQRLRDDQAKAAKTVAIAAHLKQADAYAKAGAWAKAGDELQQLASIDGDPQHLLDAADAFRKQPDNVKARDALLAYLEKVPLGAKSDEVRRTVAELERAIEKADAERTGNKLPKPPAQPRDAASAGMASTAKAAAARGDCKTARILVDKLHDSDPDYYEVVAAEITSCGIAASNEPDQPAGPARMGLGGTLGVGYFRTADFVGAGNVSAPTKFGGSLLLGIFLDIPVGASSHAHVGARAQLSKIGYSASSCSASDMCPDDLFVAYGGIAAAIEPSLHRGPTSDVYATVGAAALLPLGNGNLGFRDDGVMNGVTNTAVPGLQPQLEVEAGLGLRFDRIFMQLMAQLSITGLSDKLDVGNARTFYFTFGWSSQHSRRAR